MQSPEHYREMAKFMRKQADDVGSENLRASYLKLASDYDILADQAAEGRGERRAPGDSAKRH